MGNEIGTVTETFPTVKTLIRFFSSVDSSVSDEACTPTEAFPTVSTFIWILYLMRHLIQEMGVWAKAFAISEIFIGSVSQAWSLISQDCTYTLLWECQFSFFFLFESFPTGLLINIHSY